MRRLPAWGSPASCPFSSWGPAPIHWALTLRQVPVTIPRFHLSHLLGDQAGTSLEFLYGGPALSLRQNEVDMAAEQVSPHP